MLYSDYVGTPATITDAIDANAFMQVFCPKFLEDIKPNSMSEMGLVDYMEVLEVYSKDIKPFIEALTTFLAKKKED